MFQSLYLKDSLSLIIKELLRENPRNDFQPTTSYMTFFVKIQPLKNLSRLYGIPAGGSNIFKDHIPVFSPAVN